MNSSIDLNLLLLAQQGGIEKAELPDLYAVTPPRRTARGREGDSLVIYLSLTGNFPLPAENQTPMLEQMAREFYKTAGSLTSAMRTITEGLNQQLLDRNLRNTGAGRQGIGQLILLALHADTVYLAQCGSVHAFLVTPRETQHLYDPQSSGRGLGLSRTTTIRFLQVRMDPDDYLVLSTRAAPDWTSSSIKHPQQQGIEAMRRQLLESGAQEFNSVIVQAQPGTGRLVLLRRKAEPSAMAHPSALAPQVEGTAPVPSWPATEPGAFPVEDKRLGLPSSAVSAAGGSMGDRQGEVPSRIVEPAPQAGISNFTTQAPSSTTIGAGRGEADQQPGPSSVPPPLSPAPKAPSPDRQAPPIARYYGAFSKTLSQVGSTILKALRSALATIGEASVRLLKNMLPDADVFRLPPSMMVFIAIAIPLVLATIGGLVFLQRGRSQQHEIYYQQAAEQATYAATLNNPLEQRLAWQSVLGDLDKAEDYTLTSKSQELRTLAVSNLDNLDAIKRLDYKQAIVGGLDNAVNVTRIIATATDLYMLDAAQGSVIRAIMTGRGYEIDTNFQCGPTYGPIDVGPLVDIAELQPGAFENASLLAMDANANLLFCVVGGQPYSAAMAPPNTGFGEPTGMTLDRGDLYVLDPKVNAVWNYRDLVVREQPRLFFGDYVPPMEDVIDLAVYNDDLYLLHADGHITKCTYSALAESPTRCDDPYPYSDNRPGRIHGPIIADTVFSQIYFQSFPERSIYLLDPQKQAIYYFSVLLNLQWQYQPVVPVAEGKASAFAISPNRTAFLAIGNYVFYAAMP